MANLVPHYSRVLWGRERDGRRGEDGGGTESLHTRATRCHLFSLFCPIRVSFTFCMCTGDMLETRCGSRSAVFSVDTSQHPTALSVSLSLLFVRLPLSPPLLPPLCHLPLCQPPDSVVIINTPSSWADAWLESASSPVAGLKSDGVCGEAQRVSESQVMQHQTDRWRGVLSVTSEMWWMHIEALRCEPEHQNVK